MRTKPLAFISYSWDGEEHKQWTYKLFHILRDNGVEVLIDKYEVLPGSNLEEFMLQGLSESRYVLCICSEGYLKRVNDPETGVGKEVEIIRANDRTDFIIPIMRDNPNKILPEFLEDKSYIDFNDVMLNGMDQMGVSKTKELLAHLLNIDDALRPQTGSNPFEALLGHDVIVNTKIRQSMYVNPELTGKAEFDYSNNDGSYTIGSGDFSFTTEWTKASDMSIYAYNDASNIERIAIVKQIMEIPEELLDVEGLDFTSRVRKPKRGDGIVWLNTSGHFAITVIRDIKDDTRSDKNDWLEFEYRIYLVERSINF